MPAIYAHNRFGEMVARRMSGELKDIIIKYYPQFRIGLQGPDIFFFYRPFMKSTVRRHGFDMHAVSVVPFLEHAMTVVKEKGRNSEYYAYLLGFLGHFILDSECHPYVGERIRTSGIEHLEIEEEFEKFLLRLDGQDPVAYPTSVLIPTDRMTAEAISAFHEGITGAKARESLYWMKWIKRLFTAPQGWQQFLLNTAFRITGHYAEVIGLMNQRKDNPRCRESNEELYQRMNHAVPLAVRLLESFDESLCTGMELDARFDRNFE